MHIQSQIILITTLLIISTVSITNPGILLTFPFPYAPPIIDLQLPLKINDVVISNLQLKATELRQIDYTWKLTQTYAQINISRTVISFDWFYKKDKGKGFYLENQLKIDFYWNFTMNSQNRFEVQIPNSKIHPGKIKIQLGGGISQTIALQITNLILNHASIIYRGIIANKLSQVLTDSSKILGKDLLIYHDKSKNQNIKINTTLVSAPMFSSQILYLQINGAPYIQGKKSGFLSPPDVLTKANSTKIQVQIHKQLFAKILQLVIEIRGEVFIEFQSTSITSVVDIDSLALSPVFPLMGQYPQNKNVIFSVHIPTISFDFSGQDWMIKLIGQCIVSTSRKSDKVRSLYMNPINVSASAEISTIFGPRFCNVRARKLQITNFSPEMKDVSSGLIEPKALSQYFDELMQWVTQAINFEFNKKVIGLSYENIKIILKGNVIKDISYNIEIDLK